MFDLTEKETKLFDILKQVAKDKAPEGTILRVAGGWVRDRWLGQKSDDIDIAINNMSGKKFAEMVVEWLRENNQPYGKVSVIAARPEQSKHLETAILTIGDLDIDFVNLRKESYADSRIPVIEPGTPEEDAMRRDLTINALFYNINSGNVEDYTCKGIDDLKNGICRTPIDTLTTFIDDPLRVLRAIRFTARFDFTLDQDIVNAAKSPQVQGAFRGKISKERIWKEMIGQETPQGWKKGFLVGENPPYAIQMLVDTGFRDVLFEVNNKKLNPWNTDQNNIYHDMDIWEHTFTAYRYLWTDSYLKDILVEDTIVRTLTILLHDMGKRDMDYRQLKEDGTFSYLKHEIASAKYAKEILNNLSAPANIRDRIVLLVEEHTRFMLPPKPSDRSLRRIMRDTGKDWENLLDVCMADAHGKRSATAKPEIREFFEYCRARCKELIESQDGDTKVKRPISGHDLMNELGYKPGRLMGDHLKLLDEQLLEYPDMSREAALDFIRQLNMSTTQDTSP